MKKSSPVMLIILSFLLGAILPFKRIEYFVVSYTSPIVAGIVTLLVSGMIYFIIGFVTQWLFVKFIVKEKGE